MTRERSIVGRRSKHVSNDDQFQTRRRLDIPRPVSGRAKHTMQVLINLLDGVLHIN